MKTHEDIQSLLPGYALDALEPGETSDVRRHLRRCPSCRRELEAYARVTDGLALSVPEASPPPALEERLMRAAGMVRPQRSVARRLILNPGMAAAAAILIVVLAAGNVAQWVRSPEFRARSRGLVTVELLGSGAGRDAYGTIVVDPGDSEGVLAVRGLPRLEPSLRYQLWLARDDERLSGGAFTVNEDGYGSLLIRIPGGFRGFRTFSISVEPAEGSPSPTTAPILSGSL